MAFHSVTMGAFIMKKIVILFTIAFLAAGALSARDFGGGNPESAKIDGTLQLYNGQFAVASGNNIYFVPRIGRYVGFIDGLKEGASVSFEGYVAGNFLRPLKMTVSGKSYDLGGSGAANGAYGGRRRGDFGNRGSGGFGGCFGPCGNGYGPGGNRPRDNFRGRR